MAKPNLIQVKKDSGRPYIRWIAACPSMGVWSSGSTQQEAVQSLKNRYPDQLSRSRLEVLD